MKAFSLIELMVVVAIVALLAAIAVPAYSEFIERSRVSDINVVLESSLNEWAVNYSKGSFQTYVKTNPTEYITSVQFVDSLPAAVTLVIADNDKLPDDLRNLSMYFNANVSSGVITWTCDYYSDLVVSNPSDEDIYKYFGNFGSCSRL